MTDVELDARVTALEENGGGSIQNGNNLSSLCKFNRNLLPEMKICHSTLYVDSI